MNGENLYRDYCKAENSEDEESIIDLQSRLYAEVYYAPTVEDSLDAKSSLGTTPFAADEKVENDNETDRHKNTNTTSSRPFGFVNIFPYNDNFDQDDSKTSMEFPCTSELAIKVDKSKVEPVHTQHGFQKPSSNLGSKPTNLTEMLNQHCHKGDTKFITDNTVKESMTSHEMASTKIMSNAKANNVDLTVKSEVRVVDEERKKKDFGLLHSAQQVKDKSSNLYLRETITDNSTVDTMQPKFVEATDEKGYENIRERYNFSKEFINKLYLQKYETLEKKLQEEEEQVEREREQQQQNCDIDINEPISVTDEMETDTRYTVLEKNEKEKRKAHECSEETLLLENETDSEDSILEVPLPPKPKPVLINLQDSDDDGGTLSSDNEAVDLEYSDAFKHKYNLIEDVQLIECKRSEEHQVSKNLVTKRTQNNLTNINTNNEPLPIDKEDLVLNCTRVQKGACSIQEIREMKKSIQHEGSHKFHTETFTNHNEPLYGGENCDDALPAGSQIPRGDTLNCNDKQHVQKNPLPKSNTSKSTISEKDTSATSVDAMGKKRRSNQDDAIYIPNKQMKYSNNKGDLNQVSGMQHNVGTQRNNTESWEEYIFRPMSNTLRAFYTDSRGQENFDVNEIQSKMSKDPRLWAILDEDLMPSPRIKRFWNVRCTQCQREGHQRHNCPEPRKPLRCHICGTQGHTEPRCPQKMCLTCGKRQGTFRQTCESCRTLYCDMCEAIGHISTECPDLWRRFHQTTQNSEINIPDNLNDVMKPADLLYCCNCTRRGHDSSTCNEYRWSQHFPTPAYVSNYTSGPKYIARPLTRPREVDVIPLSKQEALSKMAQIKEDEKMLYSCGSREVKNWSVIVQALDTNTCHLNAFLEGRVAPHFLKKLLNIARFKVDIHLTKKQKVKLRVKGLRTYYKHIYNFALHWFELEDDEKDHSIYLNLSRNKKEMLSLLTLKLSGLNKDLKVPEDLWKNIVQLKKEIATTTDNTVLSSKRKLLSEFQIELLKVYHVQLVKSKTVTKLRGIVDKLKSSNSNLLDAENHLLILLLYNKLFVPHTPMHVKHFFEKRGIGQKQKKKVKLNDKMINDSAIYEKFLRNLNGCKKRRTKKQQEQTSDLSKASQDVAQGNASSDKNITETVTVNCPSTESTKETGQNAEGISNTYPIEIIQLPRNQEACNIAPERNVPDTRSGIVPANLIPIPLEDRLNVHTVTQHPPDIQTKFAASDVPYIQSNVRQNISTLNEQTQGIKDTLSESKKSKKAKSAKNSQDNTKETTINNESLVLRAKKVIQKAFAFRLPYMSKAAMEVEKRLTDNSIRAKHVDVLEKLVNLEKSHQKHVNSFYSHLE